MFLMPCVSALWMAINELTSHEFSKEICSNFIYTNPGEQGEYNSDPFASKT